MDDATARELITLNNRFYAEHAASFDATRQAPWAGWERLLALMRERGFAGVGDRTTGVGASASTGSASNRARNDAGAGSGKPGTPTAGAVPTVAPARVLDVACGNLRFERFLSEALPGAPFEFHAVDACTELAGAAASGLDRLRFYQVDVLAALLKGEAPLPRDVPPADLVVCFGFMHHVPGTVLRHALLKALIDAAAPGGIICLSFWQFMDDARLAAKAQAADRAAATAAPPWPGLDLAALDAGDHFLGWQGDPGPLRYCHHFTEAEIDELAASATAAGADEVARYSADGTGGALNRYLVLQHR